MNKIVIAGASAAGLNAARELRRRGFDGSITLVDRELGRPYRRPEVSKGLVQGSLDLDAVAVPWPDDIDLDLLDGVTLRGVDFTRREVDIACEGETDKISFDGLVIATGAVARQSPLLAARGVHTLRTAEDALRMQPDLADASQVAIVGGGFIGLEVAAVCRAVGKHVTVLEATDMPLGRVLGKEFSAHLVRMHLDRGVRIETGASVEGLETDGDSITGVRLADGRRLPADLLLVAIGSTPEVTWLDGSGLDTTDGVVCDHTCAVQGLTDVVAAGDVASWFNPRYGMQMRVEHWSNAVEQGMYAARRLLGTHDPAGYSTAPYFWSDQHGYRIQSIGTTAGHDEVIVIEQSGDRMLVAYGRGGQAQAIAGVDAGHVVTRLRTLVSDGAPMAAVCARATELLNSRR